MGPKEKKELKLIEEKIKEFESINIKLRKNKLGSIAIQWAKQSFFKNDDLVFLIIDNEKIQREIDCFIAVNTENVTTLPLNALNGEKEIKDLMKMFKIKINFFTISLNSLQQYPPKTLLLTK